MAPFYRTIVPVEARAVPCVGSDSGGTATEPDRARAEAVSHEDAGRYPMTTIRATDCP